MPSIYSQATVTIAATRAHGVHEGLLQPRNLSEARLCQSPFISLDGTVEQVILFPDLHDMVEPLDDRGWALQERFLTTRYLSYGRLQTRWTCTELDAILGNPGTGQRLWVDGWIATSRRYMREPLRRFPLMEHRLDQDSTRDTVDLASTTRKWLEVVQEYTARSLIYHRDRLPALSGVARTFQEILRDKYRAGLWWSDLARGLLWSTQPKEAGPTPPVMTLSHNRLNCPTWSWAAVDSAVWWLVQSKLRKPLDLDFQLLHCTMETTGIGPFGNVLRGNIVLKCRLKETNLETLVGDVAWNMRLQDISACELLFDTYRTTHPWAGDTVFLMIVLYGDENGNGPVGLILRLVRNDTYNRIGMFQFRYYRGERRNFDVSSEEDTQAGFEREVAWLNEGATVQTITII